MVNAKRLIGGFLYLLLCACQGDSSQKNTTPEAVASFSSVGVDQVTTIRFSSAGSVDADGDPISFSWDFGDGTFSTDANPTHQYLKSGSFSASLTVKDDKGASSSKTLAVTIGGNAVVVPLTGAGTVALPDIVTLQVDAGTFPTTSNVGVWTTTRTETQQDWVATSVMFTAATRASYEIRVNTANVAPMKAVHVTAKLPAELAASLGTTLEPQGFVQIYQDGGEEVLDGFELMESSYSKPNQTISFDLSPLAFTNKRTSDQSYEAVILLGTTKTAPVAVASTASASSRGIRSEAETGPPADAFVDRRSYDLADVSKLAVTPCAGTTLSPPLASLTVTGPFNPPGHYGTDFRAANGTSVMAMASGTVTKVGFDERPLKVPDPRSGKLVKGWGNYVVITTPDQSVLLYAHLQTGDIKVAVGATVTAGSVIALSDNSGGSQAPHLHVEYAPFGGTYQNKGAKVDPAACIGNSTGSISVRDNGNIADDAFAVSINGREVCRTTIGATNNCVVGALRSGTAVLTLTVVTAPDDVGTYEITLSNGLSFSDGTFVRSGTAPQNAVVSFSINIA